MADIFISYSKADRDLVVTLAAFLEAQGFTTWWDKELAPGDRWIPIDARCLGRCADHDCARARARRLLQARPAGKRACPHLCRERGEQVGADAAVASTVKE